LLVHGWWFSPGIPDSSTTNTGCHDIAEILLKVALNPKNQKIKSPIPGTLTDKRMGNQKNEVFRSN
jgi:hypothetical protein